METHHITPARGLSETGLKWIALVTMVLDHIHYFFQLYRVRPRVVQYGGAAGRPCSCFCLVEGFTHTHSRKRYFARSTSSPPPCLSCSSSWPLPTCWCGLTGSTPPTA